MSPLRASLPALALLCAGCNQQPFVEGSLGELLDLHFMGIVVEGNADELAVRYTRQTDLGEDTILHVSAVITGLDPAWMPGDVVQLGDWSPTGGQRGRVARAVQGEPNRSFPPLARGEFTLDAVPESGTTLHGRFAVTFQDGTAFASGRTAFHNFEATVP